MLKSLAIGPVDGVPGEPLSEPLPPVHAATPRESPRSKRAVQTPQTARPAESLPAGGTLPPTLATGRATTSHSSARDLHTSGALTARPTTHAYQQMRAAPTPLRVGVMSRGAPTLT